jgi:hypothetical protein
MLAVLWEYCFCGGERCITGGDFAKSVPGLVKTGDIGMGFLVPAPTAFGPGAFSFPGRAWERKGRAALPRIPREEALWLPALSTKDSWRYR